MTEVLIGAFLAAVILVPFWVAFIVRARGSVRVARAVLWVGAFGPFLYLVSRTADDVSAGGFSTLDLVRGGLPLLALVTSHLIAGPPSPGRRWKAPGFFLASYVIWACASTLWSIDSRATLLKVIVFALMWLCIWRLISYYGTRRAALDGIVNVVHLLLIAAPVQFLVSLAVPGINPFGTSRLAMFAPSIHPNLLGVIVVAGLMGVLLNIGPKWARSTGTRILLFVLFIAELVAIDTRSALLFGVVSLLIVSGALLRKSPMSLSTGCFAFAGGLLFIAFRPDVLAEVFTRGQSEEQLFTLTGRTDIWDLGWRAFENSPIFGQGFYAGTRLGIDARWNGWRVSNVDHTWLESLIDVGIIGTVMLGLFVIVSVCAVVFRPAPLSEKSFMLSVVFFGVAVSFFNPTLQSPTSTAVVLGAILLAASLPAEEVPGNERQQGARRVQMMTVLTT
ncbi:O-antigen ligase family protein (plasmid) [Coraliomargarita sp. W4R53]